MLFECIYYRSIIFKAFCRCGSDVELPCYGDKNGTYYDLLYVLKVLKVTVWCLVMNNS